MRRKLWRTRRTIRKADPNLLTKTLLITAGFFVLGLAVLGVAVASSRDEARRTHSSVLVATENARVLRGAELYYRHCSVCHGDRASGLAEARLSFPKEHQRCERCHRLNNPPQMNLGAMTWRSAFSIGEAPALVGKGALAAFPNAQALLTYTSATMPRPFPNKLTLEEYESITLFLLEANGIFVGTEKPIDLTVLELP